ncbi:MAG: glutathione S-transferase family protein [Pseudomonadota bacterium]
MAITLYGYHYSVYVRIVRMVLLEKGLTHQHVEVDPFEVPLPDGYKVLHPFGRVPTLRHDDFVLYETGAIVRYLDEAFSGPSLQPDALYERARMSQIMSIVDNYAYWPLVRQVYSQRVFGPCIGEAADEGEIAQGLERAAVVLAALEEIAESQGPGDGPLVNQASVTHISRPPASPSLADLYLAVMAADFIEAPEGKALWQDFPKLSAWWHWIKERDCFLKSDPGPPS